MKNGEDYTSRMVHPVGSAPYRRGYDPSLYYIDGREYSFEEVRAARLGHVQGLDDDDAVIINANARLKALEQEKQKVNRQGSASQSAAELKKRKEEEEARKRKLREEKLKKLEEEEQALARMKRSLTSPSSEKQDTVNNKRRREEVPVTQQPKITSFMQKEQPAATTTTQVRSAKKSRTSIGASQEEETMATITMQKEQQRSVASRSPTMTMHTKNAYARLLPMFSDTNNQTQTAPRGSTTPTMTINTKSAHAQIASMFSAPLAFDEEEEGDGFTAELDSVMRGGDRENIPPSRKGAAGAQGQRKRGPLAVHQAEKKVTNGDILKEYGRGSLYAGTSDGTRSGKKTNADAIREAFAGVDEEEVDDDEEVPEETQEYVDTVSLAQVRNRAGSAGVGFQIYEDLDGGAVSPPKPRKLEMKADDESYLAAFEDTQQIYGDADQSTMFGISDSTPRKPTALKVFEDPDCATRTRDLSLSNIRSFADMTDHGGDTPPIKVSHITDDGDLTLRGGGSSPSFFSTTNTHNSSGTGSFTGFTPSPRQGNNNGRNSATSSARRSSRRNSNSADQGVTPLTYRKGFEPHAAPPRTPFAPKNENLLHSPNSKTPSPLKKQAPQLVDVTNPSLLARHLAALDNQVRGYEGFIDCSDEKAPGARILKVPKGRRVSVGGLDPTLELRNCPPLEVERRIGEGAFASVHLVERTDVDPMLSKPLALKVQEPPCPWEWYIYNEVQQRVAEDLLHCFIKFHSLHMYKDKSLILMDFYHHSLQDVISLYRVAGKPMDEVLVIYYTIEMMKIMDGLHKTGIIHGDIKPDNWLIRNDPCENWDNWGTGVAGGWDTKGLVLIDFGRAIDTTLYPASTRFTGDIGADTFTCVEMKEGKPWTYQADYFAFLGVVHCLLHNNYMDIISYKEGGRTKWKPRENFKRYWQSEKLWKPLFDALLNVEDCDHQPDLGYFIKTFEEYLLSSRKALSVRTLLSKQGIMLHENQSKGAKA